MTTPKYIPSGSIITISFTFVGNAAREYSGLGTTSGDSFMPGFTQEVANDNFAVDSYQDTSLLSAGSTSLVVELKTTADYDSLDSIQSILEGDVDDQLAGTGQSRSTSVSINKYQLAGAPIATTVTGAPASTGNTPINPSLPKAPLLTTTSEIVIGIVAVLAVVVILKFL